MTPRDLRNIHTTRSSSSHVLPCMNMALKPADGEASWLLLPSLISLLSDNRVEPENTYSCILKVTGHIWESQKRISINTNHCYHQHSSPYASLNWSNNKASFSFNQPNRKRWGAKLVDVKHLSHKAFLSWFTHILWKMYSVINSFFMSS